MLHRQSYTTVAIRIRHKSCARTIEFGRYKNFTYAEVVQSDPSYCAWVLDVVSHGNTSRALAEFARYCQTRLEFQQNFEQNDFPSSSRDSCTKVGFGTHKELTYREVFDQNPSYCDWVLQTVNEKSPAAMLQFAAFLSTSPGIDTMIKHLRTLSDDATQASAERNQSIPHGLIGHMRNSLLFSNLARPYHIAHMLRACRKLQINYAALLTLLERKATKMIKGFNAINLSTVIWAIAELPRATYAFRALALDEVALKWGDLPDSNVRVILHYLPVLIDGTARQKFLDALTSIVITQQSHNTKATSIGILCAHAHEKCMSQGTLLPERLLRKLALRVDLFDHNDIVTVVCAMARLNRGSPQVLDSVARKAIDESSHLIAEHIANVAWAYAKISSVNHELFEALALSAVTKIDSFHEMGIANMAWSFATLKMFDGVLFEALASVSVHKRVDFAPQGISNMAWAFAKVDCKKEELFDMLAAAAIAMFVHKHVELAPQGISRMAWAFARVSCKHNKLFSMLASAAIDMVGNLDEQAVSNILWAFATQRRCDSSLMDTLADSIANQTWAFVEPQQITNIVWAFAKLKRYDSYVFATLKASTLEHLPDFETQHISNTLWAVVRAGQHDESFVSAVARAAFDLIGEFTEHGTGNMLWAIVRIGFSSRPCGSKLCSSLVRHAHANNWVQLRDSPDGQRSAIEAHCAELISATVHRSLRNQTFMGFELDIVVQTNESIVNIEIDGPRHQIQEQQLIDSRRDAFLGSLGIHVERVNPYSSTGAIRDDLSHALHAALEKFDGAIGSRLRNIDSARGT